MSADDTARLDQALAAVRDAHGMVRAGMDLCGAGGQVLTRPLPHTLRLLDGLLERTATDALRTCRHLTGSPQAAWLFGWDRGWLRCNACARLALRRVQGTPEDGVCDICRRAAGAVQVNQAAIGALVLLYGSCPPCTQREMAASR